MLYARPADLAATSLEHYPDPVNDMTENPLEKWQRHAVHDTPFTNRRGNPSQNIIHCPFGQ